MAVLKWILTALGGLGGCLAAALWWYATTIKVPKPTNSEIAKRGWAAGATISVNGNDPFATAELQNSWNRYAALATAIAVILQTAASVVPAN